VDSFDDEDALSFSETFLLDVLREVAADPRWWPFIASRVKNKTSFSQDLEDAPKSEIVKREPAMDLRQNNPSSGECG
jgi:hypothetical protein